MQPVDFLLARWQVAGHPDGRRRHMDVGLDVPPTGSEYLAPFPSPLLSLLAISDIFRDATLPPPSSADSTVASQPCQRSDLVGRTYGTSRDGPFQQGHLF